VTDSRRLPVVLLAATLAAGVLAYLAKDVLRPLATPVPASATTSPKEGFPTGPRIVLARDGARRDLASKTGKGLILHFWATWCAPCREEMPELVKFVKDTKGDANVEFLAVSVDEDWKVVDGWLKEHGIAGLPVALDPKGAIASRYGATGYPETFFIAPSGEIVQHFVGMADWSKPQVRTFAAEFSRASGAMRR
jgi:thiol-disulfide isomerase/thioredoxin